MTRLFFASAFALALGPLATGCTARPPAHHAGDLCNPALDVARGACSSCSTASCCELACAASGVWTCELAARCADAGARGDVGP